MLKLRFLLMTMPLVPDKSMFSPSLLNFLGAFALLSPESPGSGVPASDLIVGMGFTLPWKSLLYRISGELGRADPALLGVRDKDPAVCVGVLGLAGEADADGAKVLDAMLGVTGWEKTRLVAGHRLSWEGGEAAGGDSES